PQTKEKFFHHGMDLTANGAALLAVASGTVTGLGSDPIHEGYVKIRYGNYEVEYGHVTEIPARRLIYTRAGQQVSYP
ncbi:MAG: M23 family peptidase, partial [Synergistaceae bacterium]|nr:M23 family peptidase [Synergistaceae bacterium]